MRAQHSPSRIAAWWVGAAVAAGLTPATVSVAAIDDTQLVSRANGVSGAKSNGDSMNPVLSGDGRFSAYHSSGSNLDPADGDPTDDVFAREPATGATVLVSRATGAAGAKGNGTSSSASASADGRYVAFDSLASNIEPADPDATRDVFVRDMQSATTLLVSRATGVGGAKGDGDSRSPSISADGRFVAFVSEAANLDPADGDAVEDIYLRDLQSNTTLLVSRATGTSGAKGNGLSVNPVVSADGRYVAFHTYATNIAGGDGDAIRDVVVRDTQSATTTLVSRATGVGGAKGTGGGSFVPSISADGRYVLFISQSTNLDSADTDVKDDVYLRDLQTASTLLVSRATGLAGAKSNGNSYFPELSGNGRYAVYSTRASNLTPADADVREDIVMRDLQTATTTLVSRASGPSGAKGDGYSYLPESSDDGRFVTFESTSTNIEPSDGDTTDDVFVRDVLGPPVVTPPPPPPASATPPSPVTVTPPPGPAGPSQGVVTPPPASSPAGLSATSSDSDGDGIKGARDTCPAESSKPRDANRNGCLDYLRVRGRFVFTSATYARRPYRGPSDLLGLTAVALVGRGLPEGAVAELHCTRHACPPERLTVDSTHRVSFRRIRGRRLATGTKLVIRATMPGAVGKGTRYDIKPNAWSKRVFCLRPGTGREGACSTVR